MCFLPNRRASIDQAPGPIIANAAATAACARLTHGSPECEKSCESAIHTLTPAASAPASGVNSPANRSIAAAMPIIWRAILNDGGHSRMSPIPKPISVAPVSKRRRRRPAPGHPSANVENSRCTRSHQQNRNIHEGSAGLKLGSRDPHFGGSKLDDSALQGGRDRVSSIVGVKLCKDICDMAFHRFLGDEEFACDFFVRIAGCN